MASSTIEVVRRTLLLGREPLAIHPESPSPSREITTHGFRASFAGSLGGDDAAILGPNAVALPPGSQQDSRDAGL
jgi:hypothetical protein